jgi:hypothetical protein
MIITFTNILYCKTLQNLPKFWGFWVWKYTIWLLELAELAEFCRRMTSRKIRWFEEKHPCFGKPCYLYVRNLGILFIVYFHWIKNVAKFCLKNQSGWPDWVNFCLLGDCLLSVPIFCEKYISGTNNWDTFPSKTYVFIFTQNRLGYILGDFFTKPSGHLVQQYYWMYVVEN